MAHDRTLRPKGLIGRAYPLLQRSTYHPLPSAACKKTHAALSGCQERRVQMSELRGAGLFSYTGRRQGVGSGYDPPKMSELPKVAGQSCWGAGRGTAVLPVCSAMRQLSIAGQSAALRVSFQTAAP